MRLVELAHRIDSVFNLIGAQMLVAREGDDAGRLALGFRKIPFFVSERREALLKMQRDGIVNFGLDAAVDEMLEQPVAVFRFDHIEMIHPPDVGTPRGNSNPT